MRLPKFTAENSIGYAAQQRQTSTTAGIVTADVKPQARCFLDDLCVRIDSELYCIEVWNCTGKMLPLWVE